MIVDDDIDFALYESATDAQQHVRSAALYVQAMLDRVSSPTKVRRLYMPWGKTHRLLQFRPGEVTVWGGPNGSGKSLVTGQVALSLCAQDERVCIASFEMKPVRTLERQARQWTKFNLYDETLMSDPDQRRQVMDLYGQFKDWTDGKLWMYDQQGTVQWKRVCAVARYCSQQLGIKQFFVDNLMKCVAGEDDYNGQKAFVDELTSVARDEDMHIHLVHHVKKPANEDSLPGKYDFKGTGAITDQVDNVIAVWRNKTKERARQAKKIVSETEPDAKLVVDKQRNGDGWEGVIGLWFDSQSQQFLGGHNHKPMDFFAAPEDSHGDQ